LNAADQISRGRHGSNRPRKNGRRELVALECARQASATSAGPSGECAAIAGPRIRVFIGGVVPPCIRAWARKRGAEGRGPDQPRKTRIKWAGGRIRNNTELFLLTHWNGRARHRPWPRASRATPLPSH
jgi:hypothetical protein